MNTAEVMKPGPDAFERLASLLPAFAKRAHIHDAGDEFVAENYAALKMARLMSIAVPREFGGDGMEAAEIGSLLGRLAQACSSTALAFAMHTHVVALLAWRWRHQKLPAEALLKRISDQQIVLISSGGSDWLESAGTARRVEGGFEIEALKAFASGVSAGTMLNTSAVYDDPQAGPTVLHFMLPLNDVRVKIEPVWQALGMRGTGSHQVRIDKFFLADASVSGKRPQGLWHPLFHMVSMIAIPLIYSVYAGIGEALRTEAVALAKKRRISPAMVQQAGALETEAAAARYALADMLAATGGQPGPETTSRVFLGRANLVRALTALGDAALDLAGGAGYMRSHPVERLFRDLQGARFHPLALPLQQDIAGRQAFGLPLDGPVG